MKVSSSNTAAQSLDPSVPMKDSGIPWLGQIPEHWNVSKPKYYMRAILSGSATKSDVYDEPIQGLFPAYSASGQDVWMESYICSGEALILSAVGARSGKTFWASGKWNIVANTQVLQLTNRADMRYFWYLTNLPGWWDRAGAAQPYVLTQETLNRRWAFPDKKEQQKIAQFLDHETAKIDRLIAKQDKLLGLLDEERQAIISRAVTKGLDPNAPMKDSGIPWLGQIPEHWDEIALKRAASHGRNSFTDGDWVEAPFIRDSGIRLIQTGNIGIGKYKDQGFRYIDQETFYELDCKEVFPGDLLISRLAEPVGRACLAPDIRVSMITAVDVCIIKLAGFINSNYVVSVLSTNAYLSWVQAISRGGTRERISREQLGNISIPLPPIEEQEKISSYIDREAAKIDRFIAKSQRLRELLEERKQALISAAVTGQIDVRDWEPPTAGAEETGKPEAAHG